MKLTQPTVNSLTLPLGKSDAIFFDDEVPGLGLRIRGGDKRSWIFQYGIGTKPELCSSSRGKSVENVSVAFASAFSLHSMSALPPNVLQNSD